MGEKKEERREKTYAMGKEMEDVEELRAVLRAIREEVPPLVQGIVGPIRELMGLTLTEEQARERAKAIATLYKELIDAGMDKEMAMKVVESQTVDITALLRDVLQGIFSKRKEVRVGREGEDISKEIRDEIKKAIMESFRERLKKKPVEEPSE